MSSTAIDLVGDSSDESGGSRSPSPPPTQPVRPKLRTRRAIQHEDDDDDDEELRFVLRESANDHKRNANKSNANGSRPPPRASRQRNEFVPTRDSSDEENGGEDANDIDDEYQLPGGADEDGFESSVEEDEEDEEEEDDDDDEIVGRRRSGRARRSVRRTDMHTGDESEEEDESADEGDFEIRVVPRRGSRGGTSGLEHATRPRRALPPSSSSASSNTASRKRKRPPSASAAAKSNAKTKKQTRKPRQQHLSDDDETSGKRKDGASDSSDVDEDWLMTEDDDEEQSKAAGPVDEIDENAFIVEKILAREVHTLKEWTRLRQNRTTRFLTNASIFVDDSDDEGDGGSEATKEDTTTTTDDVVVVVDGPSGAPAQKEEERYLIKWKNLSYIHVSWETEKNLLDVDRNVKGKIQRYREKELLGLLSDRMHGDEYFNPEFRDVDRILDIQDTPGDKYTPVDDGADDADDDDGKPKLQYMLIKWKAQPYDVVTWEREDDVHDDAAVKEYEARLARAAERYTRMATTKTARNKARKNPKFRGYSATNTPPFKEGQTMELRDYQLTGVNWMLFNWYQGRNSMLADEMGLGKTVQTVTYVNHLSIVEELSGPYLIVAPLSTLAHWQREFTNWTNLNAVVYHGSAEARKAIQDYEFFLTDGEYRKATGDGSSSKAKLPRVSGGTCYRFDVLITTYEMCATPDFAKLARVKWQLLAVDEAHRLKNRNSKLSLLIQKNFNYENILLLTGTPLQNNIEELWTLLHFLDPGRFDSMEEFLENYGELKDSSQVEKLHGELKPFLLRRMKEDVEKSLAPKEETIIEVELTVLQKQYYRAIFEQNTEFLARGMKRSQAPSLMNVLMELRKCCNHPFLIKGMEQREVGRLREQKDLAREEMERQATELLVTASGKLILLDKLLPRLKENGHRVLIFSQFKIMLDILQDYLRLRSYRCERIDGNITGNDRQAAIDRFSDPESLSFIMLLSTRAGGVGINLTSADTVIIYDSDWNPQNDLQAQARCHRIGQKKSVKIYRLLTAKTYELHMFHQASLKLGLDQAVLGSIRDRQQQSDAVGKTKRPNAPMSKDEIENLLKHGAYEMFKEDKDGEAEAASKRFSEESIDQILSRSTTIVHDPKADQDGEEASGKKSLMSSFSKATFVSSDNPDAQVALDDPDFWTKVIGLQAPEKVEPSPLKKRRCRREVKSYLQEDSGEEETKKRGRGRPKKADADFEEFVISSSSSDDDDDDDGDGTEELDDDDFEDGKKPKKPRQVKQKLPKLYLYQERISDLLTTFGYGRWKEIAESSTILSQYPLADLITFAQELLASHVRVAATTFITAKNAPQPPVGADGQLLMAAPLPPVPPTQQQLSEWLDSYASRYRFVPTMLADMKLDAISRVLVYSPGLPRTASSAKAERDASAKLQQIDRMYTLYLFVQQQIGPVAPMMALVKDLHRVKDKSKIPKMIMDCVLPPHRPDKSENSEVTRSKYFPSEATQDVNAESKTPGDDGTSAPASKVVAEEATSVEAAVPVKEGVEGDSTTAACATVPLDPGTDKPAESDTIDEAKASATEDSASSDPAAAAAPLGVGEENEKAEKNESPEKSDVPVSDDGSVTVAKKEDVESTEKVDAATASTPTTLQEEPTMLLDAPTKPSTPTQTPTQTSLIKEQHLRVALSRLQALPDVGVPEAVAPWWISVVDDVALLLYVYKHGWSKARVLPSSLLRDDILFGSRAAAHDASLWPNMQVINRRVRALLTCWTNSKRLAVHATVVSNRERMRAAAKAAKAAPRVLVPPALPPGVSRPSTSSAPSSFVSLQPPPPFRVASDNDASKAQMAEKRMRFAKLVHQYGIPDVRGCTSDHQQLERWRYFRQDPLLDIARYPLNELLQEAQDLERFCRLRQDELPPAPPPPLPKHPVPSIFGSRRGIWQLSPTQCRRLVHRIELFRILRTELLMLPLKKLADLITKVVEDICTADAGAADQFPPWWGTPKHDVLLLQGIEHYGLDTGVREVWTLAYFVTTNPTGTFPALTWVENHVHSLVVRSHRIIQQARQLRAQHRADRLNPSAEHAHHQHVQQRQPPPPSESVERQRFRDLHGMRQEDPLFSVSAKRRKLADKQEFEQAEQAQVDAASMEVMQTAAREVFNALDETRRMRREDPHVSLVVRAFQVTQRREFEAEQKAKAEAQQAVVETEEKPVSLTQDKGLTQSQTRRPVRRVAPPPPPEAEVIELDDDDEEEEEEEQAKEDEEEADDETDPPAETDSTVTPPSHSPDSTMTEVPTAVASTEELSPQKNETLAAAQAEEMDEDTAARSSAEDNAAAASGHEDVAESVPSTTASTSSPPPTSASAASKAPTRKRAPRPWEVIVIDDSDDDDDDETTPVKRTTRSRRRRKGEDLADGL